MIVIPDIHGRSFWKEAVKDRENELIIFLGDYLDPYSYEFEGLTPDEIFRKAIDNFKEIIEFKKNHMDNVVLLLGNHDLHYFFMDEKGSRYSYMYAPEISKLFIENKKLFRMAYEKTINGKRFIFTHAGLHKKWLTDTFCQYWNEKIIVDLLNNCYDVDDPTLTYRLGDISYHRGGYESYGSMVWADIYEYLDMNEESKFENTFLVFGHTQLNSHPIITDYVADLDVRRGFEIKDDGVIYELDGKPAILYEDLKKLYGSKEEEK